VTRLDDLTADRTPGGAPDGTEPGPSSRAPAPWRARPAHVANAIVFAGAAWISATPVDDLDSYWHVEVGREILARHTLDGLGRAWLGVPAAAWQTSQWLSEVGMYGVVNSLGWTGLVALRLAVMAALFVVLTLTLVRKRQPIAASVVVVLVVVGLEILFQDRPATLSLLFFALLGPACERLWTTGSRPPALAVAAVSVLWAQLHGLWVLAPAAFGLVAVGALLDRRTAPAGQLRGALICAVASTAGVLNPQGLTSFLLPLRFRQAGASRISEWFPTAFTISLTIAWGLLVLLLIFAWVRSPVRVGNTELLWCAAWTVFALSAMRNVGPVILLMAPVVLRALERSFGERLGRLSAQPSTAMARVLAAMLAAVLVAGVTTVGVSLLRMDPLDQTPALAIARRLAQVPGPVRVYNGYNTSGSLIAFAGGADGHVQLVVDGRADLWGGHYIERLVDVQNIHAGWEEDLRLFRPDAVVMPSDAPMVSALVTSGGWRYAMTDDQYVLLLPRGSKLLG
jgi:hypothetical protein